MLYYRHQYRQGDDMDYTRDEHRVHLIIYHLVWTPKRRKPVLAGLYELALDKTLQSLCYKAFKAQKCITLLTHIDLCSAPPASSFVQVPT